jgi:hypothetical protein
LIQATDIFHRERGCVYTRTETEAEQTAKV